MISVNTMPCRTKDWVELSDAEKITRLHEQAKIQEITIDSLVKKMYKMEQHIHNNQELLIPYSEKGGMVTRNRDNKYF